MKPIRYFLFFLNLLVTHAAVIVRESGDSVLLDADVEMRFAGSADGKSFFAYRNNTGSMSWFEAGAACQSMNMVLAEITSQNQEATIHASSKSGQIWDAEYWIGGRDSQETRQFSWNSTNTEFSLFNTVFHSRPAFATCIKFRPYVNSSSFILLQPCTNKYRNWMCQS